jgi:hypothetical protein
VATSTDVLRILLTGDSRSVVQAFKDAQGAADKMSVAGRALTLGVTAPLLGLGVAAVGAASDLNEAASKVGVVFGEQAGIVQDFAETTTQAYGLSERAALEAAGTLGNLVVSLGGTQEAAADLSVDLVSLAGDLASFNNLDTADVLEKLRSGLVGEVEPLRSLGVSFDAAAVSAAAMNIAIADGRSEVTEADKVMARYELIMEQTTTAQGDFARTADGLANQQRIATAEMEDAAATIGQSLLPVATTAVGIVADLAAAFGDLPAPMQDTIVKIGLAAAAIGPLLFVGGKLVAAGGAIANAMIFAGASAGYYAGRLKQLATSPTTGAIGGVAVALVGLAVAYDKLNDRQQEAARLAERVRDAIVAGGEAEVAAFIRTQAAQEGVTDILGVNEEAWADYTAAVMDGGDGLDVFVAQLANNSSALQAYRDTLALTGGEVSSYAVTLALLEESGGATRAQIVDLAQSVGLLGGAVREGTQDADALAAAERAAADAAAAQADQSGLVASALRAVTEATGDQAEAQEEVEDTLRTSSGVLNTYLGRLGELQGLTLGVSEAQIAFIEAANEAAIATYLNGQTLDLNTEKGRENQQALNDLAQAALDHAQAVEASGGTEEEYTAALAYGTAAFVDRAEAMGLNRGEAEELARSLGLIPPVTTAEVEVEMPSMTAIEGIGAAIAAGVVRGMDNGKDEVDAAAQRLVASAHRAAQDAAGIRSPSRLFADEVGGPISEGVAQGILDALDAPQSAIDTLFDELVSRANEGISSVLGAASAGFGTGSAQDRVTRAEQAVAGAKTPEEKARAERDLLEAQLGLVSATQQMIEAGQELLGQGAEGEALFRRVAGQAGLTMTEIDRLVAQARNSANIAEGYLPGDVSGLIGSGEGNPAVQQNITINMPPGSNGADVVAALVSYQRQNGPIPISVSG